MSDSSELIALEFRRLNYQAERLEHVYGMNGGAENIREAAVKLEAHYNTLRAQLEAAEAETYAVEEASSEWREKFDARTIDWNEACAARDVWMQRAKDAQALLDAVGKEVESWRKPSPYMHGCCHEAVENMCDEIDAARTKEQQA